MQSKKQQQGVALLEVLIAIGVIAFGFLALLKLQITSLNNVVASNQRYIAADLAQNMGERIRSDFNNLSSYDGIETKDFSTDCSSGCSSMKDTNTFLWKQSIESADSALIEANGVVSVNGLVANVTVSWKEKPDTQSVTDQQFTLEVPVYVAN